MRGKTLIFIFLAGLGSLEMLAQNDVYLKGNAATLLLGMPQFGIEMGVGENSTFQVDLMGAFWESINGKPLKFAMITPEFRYYFDSQFEGVYVGPHIGGTVFEVYNFIKDEGISYHKGLGYSAGLTLGLQKRLSRSFNVDVFIGGGWHQSFYKSYYLGTNQRNDGYIKYKKRGDFLPYRAGVMISYKLN